MSSEVLIAYLTIEAAAVAARLGRLGNALHVLLGFLQAIVELLLLLVQLLPQLSVPIKHERACSEHRVGGQEREQE